MAQPLWQKLSTLATLDQKITSTTQKIEETNAEISLVKEASGNLLSQLESSKKEHKELRKKVDNIELKIKEIDDRQAKKKKALESIAHEKEYKALKKEISVLEIEHQDYEDQLVSQWHDLEKAEKKRDSKKANLEQSQQTENTAIFLIEEKLEKLTQEHCHALQERETLTKDLPSKWLDIYNKMKDKVSDPVVPAVNASCSSCYYQILHQDNALLKKNALVHCRNCYRLLYAEVQGSEQSSQEAY
jgi:hypothetical protein